MDVWDLLSSAGQARSLLVPMLSWGTVDTILRRMAGVCCCFASLFDVRRSATIPRDSD